MTSRPLGEIFSTRNGKFHEDDTEGEAEPSRGNEKVLKSYVQSSRPGVQFQNLGTSSRSVLGKNSAPRNFYSSFRLGRCFYSVAEGN